MNSNEYHNLILSGICDIAISQSVNDFLSELVKHNQDNFDCSSDTSTSFFYDALSQKVKTYDILNLSADDVKIVFIKESIKWLIDNWRQIAVADNFRSSIIAYSLLEYFHITDDCLFWENIDDMYIQKIMQSIFSINLLISIPNDAPYHEKKGYDAFIKDVEIGNFGGIISFLDHFWSFRGLNIFASSLVKIAFRLCPLTVASFLNSVANKPLIVKAILDVINHDRLTVFFINDYNESAVFPLIYFFDKKVTSDSRAFEKNTIVESKEMTCAMSRIFDKIIKRLNCSQPLNFVYKNLHLSMSDYFHLILGNFVANNNNFASEYVNSIDFSLSQNSGIKFWQGLISNCNDLSFMNSISEAIEKKYYSYYAENRFLKLHQYCSYFNFLYTAIRYRCSTIENYCVELQIVVDNINQTVGSWSHLSINLLLHKLYLYISCNAVMLNYTNQDNLFKNIIYFIEDDRLKAVFGEEQLCFLVNCINNPSEITKIILCDNVGNRIDLVVNKVAAE